MRWSNAPGLLSACKRRIHHAAEAGRHGEAHVVGLLRQQQRLRLAHLRAIQRALGIAGDEQMAHVLHQRLGKRDGLQALGAVAGAAEGHQQQRLIGVADRDEGSSRCRWSARRRRGGEVRVENRREAMPPMYAEVPAPVRMMRASGLSATGAMNPAARHAGRLTTYAYAAGMCGCCSISRAVHSAPEAARSSSRMPR